MNQDNISNALSEIALIKEEMLKNFKVVRGQQKRLEELQQIINAEEKEGEKVVVLEDSSNSTNLVTTIDSDNEKPVHLIEEKKHSFSFDKFKNTMANFIVDLSPNFYMENKDKLVKKYEDLKYRTLVWINEHPVKQANKIKEFVNDSISESVQTEKIGFTDIGKVSKKLFGKVLNFAKDYASGDFVLLQGQKKNVIEVKKELGTSLDLLGFDFESLRFDRNETFAKELSFDKSFDKLVSRLEEIGFVINKEENSYDFSLSLSKVLNDSFDQETKDEVLNKFVLPKLISNIDAVSKATEKINQIMEKDKFINMLRKVSAKYDFKNENVLLSILNQNPQIIMELNDKDKELKQLIENKDAVLKTFNKYKVALNNSNFLLKNLSVAINDCLTNLSEESAKVIKEKSISSGSQSINLEEFVNHFVNVNKTDNGIFARAMKM